LIPRWLCHIEPGDLHVLISFDLELLHQPRIFREIVAEELGELRDRASDRLLCGLQKARADPRFSKRTHR
jgi:hypothetical protein